MNTIQVQLNEKQFDDLVEIIGYVAYVRGRVFEFEPIDEDKEDVVMDLTSSGGRISSLKQALASTKRYLWTDSYGYIDLDIAAEHVDAIAVSGDNEPACREAIENDGYLRRQLEELNMGLARAYLKDAGIEDVDSKDDDLVRVYILWMACHDINDEAGMED